TAPLWSTPGRSKTSPTSSPTWAVCSATTTTSPCSLRPWPRTPTCPTPPGRAGCTSWSGDGRRSRTRHSRLVRPSYVARRCSPPSVGRGLRTEPVDGPCPCRWDRLVCLYEEGAPLVITGGGGGQWSESTEP